MGKNNLVIVNVRFSSLLPSAVEVIDSAGEIHYFSIVALPYTEDELAEFEPHEDVAMKIPQWMAEIEELEFQPIG